MYKKENVVMNKSKAFALRIIKLYKIYVIKRKNMFYPNRFLEQELVLELI